ESGIRKLLPDKLAILLNNGSTERAEVSWDLTRNTPSDEREAVTWSAEASVTLPDTVSDDDNVLDEPVRVTITVDEADYARAPMADVEAGTYIYDFEVMIRPMETGGTTYVKIGEGEFGVYDGKPIAINRADASGGKITLSAYTVKDGKWDSAVVVYEYTFGTTVPVPESRELIFNGEEQTGVPAGNFYTITGVTGDNEGCRINDSGDAVAKYSGTYTATLKINEGFVWQTDGGTTADDQTVTFTVIPAPVVTFDSGEGTGEMPSVSVTKNPYVLPDCGFTAPSGKIFSGWTAGDGTDILPAGEKLNVRSDITLTAQYGPAAVLKGYTLSLEGDIAVNFHMELTDDVLANEEAYMEFKLDGLADQQVYVKDAVPAEVGGKTYYSFKCRVPAKNMTTTINAQLICGSDKGTVYSYTVKDYANYIIENAEGYAQYTEVLSVVKSILNYGAAAQKYFGVDTDNPANIDLSTADKTVPEYTAEDINKPYDPSATVLPEGVTFEGASLSLKSETTLSLYFKSGKELIFRCGGRTVEYGESGSYKIARIRNINIRDLGENLEVIVSSGDDTGSITYSPLTYCYNVLDGDYDTKLQNVCRALYAYYLEAKDLKT
ncbi:MAG: hypothetical protein IKH76_09015, partial [Clostridiales bacterium]|nr:hypothetical protein [Clostridiales bacterium]